MKLPKLLLAIIGIPVSLLGMQREGVIELPRYHQSQHKLFTAIAGNAVDQAKALIKAGDIPLDDIFHFEWQRPGAFEQDSVDLTPLAWAAAQEQIDVMIELLQAGAEINAHKAIALKTAVAHVKRESVRLLVAHDAFSGEKVKDARDPEIAEMLLEKGMLIYTYSMENVQLSKCILKYALCPEEDNMFGQHIAHINPNSFLFSVLIKNHREIKNILAANNVSPEEKAEALAIAAAYAITAAYVHTETAYTLLGLGAPTGQALQVLNGILARPNLKKRVECEQLRAQIACRTSLKEIILTSRNKTIKDALAVSLKGIRAREQRYEQMLKGTKIEGRLRTSLVPRIMPTLHDAVTVFLRAHNDSAIAALADAHNGFVALIPELTRRAYRESQRTLLLTAAEFFHMGTVQQLLDCGVSAECQESENLFSPLMFAAKEGDVDLARLILNHQTMAGRQAVLFAQKNRDGRTALMLAAMHGHTDCVQLFFDFGASDTLLDNDGRSAFMHASHVGHEAVAKLMMDRPGFRESVRDIINRENEQGKTALACAAQSGSLAAAKIFLESGASALAKDKEQSSPWLGAVFEGHVPIAQLIYDSAVPGYRNELLREVNNRKQSPLILASMNGKTEMVRFLLSKCPNLQEADSQADAQGYTALMYACQEGHEEIVRLLLEANKSVPYVNAENSAHDTALTLACRHPHIGCVRLLLKAHAVAYLIDAEGLSPVMRAARTGNMDLLKALLVAHLPTKVGPKKPSCKELVNQQSKYKGSDYAYGPFERTTALILACGQGHLEIVKALLDYEANPAAEDNWGVTPLEAAQSAMKNAETAGNGPLAKTLSKIIKILAARSSTNGLAQYWS